MRKKILIPSFGLLILIIIISLFFTKNVIDKKATATAKKELPIIIENVENELDDLGLPSSITYDDLQVSSSGGYVILDNVNLIEKTGENFSFDEIKIGASYNELFSILKTRNFDEINSFYLEFKNIDYLASKNSRKKDYSNQKVANYLKIEFDGKLTKEIINKIDQEFPNNKQNLIVSLKGFNFPEDDYLFQEIKKSIPSFSESMLETDLSLSIEYLPNLKKISIKDFNAENDFGFLSGDFIVNYSGDSPSKFKTNRLEFNGQSAIDYKNAKLRDKEFSLGLGSGKVDFDFVINGDVKKMKEDDLLKSMIGSFNLILNDFDIKLSKKILREINRDIPGFSSNYSRIKLKKYDQDFKWDGKSLKNKMNFYTSLGSVKSDIDMDLKLNRRGDPDFDRSKLNKCYIRIGDLDKNINELFKSFENEFLMGQSFPRKGNDILINVTGSFSNPKIEGLNL